LALIKHHLPTYEASKLEIPNSCNPQKDPGIKDNWNLFFKMESISKRADWVTRLGKAMSELARNYRRGDKLVPLPENSIIYAEGQQIAKSLITDVFGRITYGLDPEATLPFKQVKDEVLRNMEAQPFATMILEGDKVTGQDFATQLADRIRVWFSLAQWELSQLDDSFFEGKDEKDVMSPASKLIQSMILEVVKQTFQDALLSYIVMFTRDYESVLKSEEGAKKTKF
jgi:hypothetical protein